MSLADDILYAVGKANRPLNVGSLLVLCQSAETTTDIAKVCLKLHTEGKLARGGTSGSYTYSLPSATNAPGIPAATAKPPKPGVGETLKNPGSAGETSPSVPDRAVAANRATPMPTPERRGSGPAPVEASAGNESLSVSLCSDGSLLLSIGTTVLCLQQPQILELGDFLERTDKFWRP